MPARATQGHPCPRTRRPSCLGWTMAKATGSQWAPMALGLIVAERVGEQALTTSLSPSSTRRWRGTCTIHTEPHSHPSVSPGDASQDPWTLRWRIGKSSYEAKSDFHGTRTQGPVYFESPLDDQQGHNGAATLLFVSLRENDKRESPTRQDDVIFKTVS